MHVLVTVSIFLQYVVRKTPKSMAVSSVCLSVALTWIAFNFLCFPLKAQDPRWLI